MRLDRVPESQLLDAEVAPTPDNARWIRLVPLREMFQAERRLVSVDLRLLRRSPHELTAEERAGLSPEALQDLAVPAHRLRSVPAHALRWARVRPPFEPLQIVFLDARLLQQRADGARA